MFSQGQYLFAIFFAICFILLIVYTYIKDLKSHKVYYKGSLKVLIVFLLAITSLYLIKHFTHASWSIK